MKFRLAVFVGCSILFALALPACVMRVDLSSSDQAAPPNTAGVTLPQPASSENIPCTPSATLGSNIASGKRIVAHAGGVNYGTHNDAEEFNSTTKPEGGDWLNETNNGNGTYQVIDLGEVYQLTGIGYYLQWDNKFANPLTVQVEVSNDQQTWSLVAKIVHRHVIEDNMNWVNIDVGICPVSARYIKFWLPPDGEWNGWGNLFQLRVYGPN
jgi:hypothetical protein